MEPEGSLAHSQQPATCPYPEPDRSNTCSPPTFLRSILILSSHLRLDLPSGVSLQLHTLHLNRSFSLTMYPIQNSIYETLKHISISLRPKNYRRASRLPAEQKDLLPRYRSQCVAWNCLHTVQHQHRNVTFILFCTKPYSFDSSFVVILTGRHVSQINII